MNNEETVILRPLARPPKLVCLWNGKTKEVKLQGHQTFGRTSQTSNADIQINDGIISRMHGEFTTSSFGCQYRDVGSTNGTWLNRMKLGKNEVVNLTDGDVLTIQGSDEFGHDMDCVMIYLTSYRDDLQWNGLSLREDAAEIVIGRMEDLGNYDNTMSRRHASLFHAKNGWALIDHGSTNGVFLNNQRLEAPKYLQVMDVIRIAGYLFVYTGNSVLYQSEKKVMVTDEKTGRQRQVRKPGGLSIHIEERNVWRRFQKKTLLKNINLNIPNGNMVLILGGSGAGKTTFMNAVMGYERAEGQIVYNKRDIYEEYDRMKYEIGYVPQQDLMRYSDTVFATLLNSAKMRLPKEFTREQYQAAAEKTLRMLGLERERNSLVSKLSGGQKKRLSIAIEYVGNPALFFLDEPDSGLDGGMATELMKNLRDIANDGKIVMVISHSPDRAFDLFDQIIVLAKGRDDTGHLVFTGSPREACTFFEVDCLEAIVKRINRPDEGGDGLADHFIQKFQTWRRQ